MLLYNSMLKINPKYYLPCWILYMDLIETKGNPEDYNFYDWGIININSCYKRNFKALPGKFGGIKNKSYFLITDLRELG